MFGYIFYLLTLVLTNLLFSTTICLFLLRYIKDSKTSVGNLFLYSLGLGPVMTSLLLYYFFLVIPGQTSVVYFVLVMFVYLLIFWFGRANTGMLYEDIKGAVLKVKNDSLKYFWFVVIAVVAYVGFWQFFVANFPILGHDILVYAVQGDVFYKDKSIEYKEHRYDEESKYYYVGKHGFTFPLLGTWGRITNDLAGTENDFYFRSVSGYYFFLLTFTFFVWLTRMTSRLVGVLGSLVYLATPGIYMMALYYHIDTARIYFLLLFIMFILEMIKGGGWLDILMAGILGGFAVSIHSISGVLVALSLFAGIFFLKGHFLKRFRKVFLIGCLILLFGGIHYCIDIVWGTGWLFNIGPTR